MAYTIHVNLKVSLPLNDTSPPATVGDPPTEATGDVTGASPVGLPRPADADTRPPASRRPPDRELVGAVLEELSGWGPRDRHWTFRRWHRGALSLVHLNVLAALEAEGSLSMSRLAESLDVSVASATGIVDRMERRGLVERRHDTEDRRVVLVHLTSAGTDVFRELGVRRREHLGRLLAELSDDDLAAFLQGIRALRAARVRLAPTDADLDSPSDSDGSSNG